MSDKVDVIGPHERKTRRYLGDLVISIRQFEAIMDVLMLQPSTVDRGKRIAAAMNGLTQATDQALWYGLGMDFRKDRKGHKGNLKAIQRLARRMYREEQ